MGMLSIVYKKKYTGNDFLVEFEYIHDFVCS